MVNYKPIYEEDVEAFMRLYKKFLDYKLDELKESIDNLPTDVIERIFSRTEIHKNEDKLYMTFGFNHVEKVAREIEACSELNKSDKLVEFLDSFGHKVNVKRVGVRKLKSV